MLFNQEFYMSSNHKRWLQVSDEVAAAIVNGRPVVALESTIIAHGMPYPQNLETAMECMQIVREVGAVPAIIGIIEGTPTVGLSTDQVKLLAKSDSVAKVSRRDIPIAMAKKLNGATTVAATMILASLAGIKIFATGGIGGVHRGAQKTMDVSADIMELAKTDVVVVCSGCKSILDIGLTLESLETQGVPVLGYQTTEFPAFYTRKSGFRLEYSFDTPDEVADTINAKYELGMHGGIVLANPIPEEFAMSQDSINECIDQAIEEAEQRDIRGKAVTPFLLSTIEQRSEGKSLIANRHLVYNNCRLAAEVAVSMS